MNDEFVYKITENIKESEESFIFERILPYCSMVERREIKKNDLIEALEKQMPKKVVRKVINTGFNLPMPTYVSVCPCCGIDTPNPRDLQMWEMWCPDCGQRLDWGEDDEEKDRR